MGIAMFNEQAADRRVGIGLKQLNERLASRGAKLVDNLVQISVRVIPNELPPSRTRN